MPLGPPQPARRLAGDPAAAGRAAGARAGALAARGAAPPAGSPSWPSWPAARWRACAALAAEALAGGFGARAAACARGDGRVAGAARCRRCSSPSLQLPRIAADRLRGRPVGPGAGRLSGGAGSRGSRPPHAGLGTRLGGVDRRRLPRAGPRVNPWGESVGELHSLPVQLAYELGVTGLRLLALADRGPLLRAADRASGRRGGTPALLWAGLLGLGRRRRRRRWAAARVAVTALPAGRRGGGRRGARGERAGQGAASSPLPVRIYAVAALLALTPSVLARWRYDRAVAAAERAGRRGRGRAGAGDAARSLLPPLSHAARPACAPRAGPAGRRRRAGACGRRRKGVAVPPLWLVAGILGRAAKRPWAGRRSGKGLRPRSARTRSALLRRCLSGQQGPDAPVYGAQALLAEPRLAGRGLLGTPSRPPRAARWTRCALGLGWTPAGRRPCSRRPRAAPGGREEPVSRLALLIDAEDAGDALPARLPPPPLARPLGAGRGPGERPGEGLRLPPAAASKGTSPGVSPRRSLPPPLSTWADTAHSVSNFWSGSPISTKPVENLVGKTRFRRPERHGSIAVCRTLNTFLCSSWQVLSLQGVEKSFPGERRFLSETTSLGRVEFSTARAACTNRTASIGLDWAVRWLRTGPSS